ncbi:MAG: DUF2339 domain-containing protein [Pseudomonadota bacterium]
MEVTLFVLVVFLFFVMRRIDRRVNDRMDKMDETVTDLQRRLKWLQSKIVPVDSTEDPAFASHILKPSAAPPPSGRKPPAWHPAEKVQPIETAPPPEDPLKTAEDLNSGVPQAAAPEIPVSVPPVAPPAPESRAPGWSERWRTFAATVDWEQFTGVRLFAWLGGLALFIAAGFFVKYSIDRDLLPPALRLAIGALTGIALIVASGRFGIEKYTVMRHTLAAGGIGVLYSVVFAATLYYEYLSRPLGFGLLALVSAAAFVLAVHYRGLAISVLGALGAYATPLLVSMGEGSLVSLSAYLAVVNVGLYQVMKRLESPMLLLTATAGTLVTMFLGTGEVWTATGAFTIAVSWIANLALFSFFLWFYPADPEEDRAFRWSGVLVYPSTLAMAVLLLEKPGWDPLLIITVAQAGALCLTWRHSGWYGKLIPFGALGFLAALAWVLLRFDASRFSAGFILLLLYGAMGGLGPLLFLRRHGLNKSSIGWLKIFPVAIVMLSLSVMLQGELVSFWFWPMLLGLELLGIGISLLFRAFLQVGLLVLLVLIGGLNWLFHIPPELVGIGFFIFVLAAGIILCAAVFLLLKKLPQWMTAIAPERAESAPSPLCAPGLEQWLAAGPAGGVCVLLAASFLMPYPLYPHPGMATLILFLSLVLFAAHRMRFEIPGVTTLLAAAAAQATCVFQPPPGLDILFPAFLWSGMLFLAALPAPFIFFRSFSHWRRLWHAWALFEAMQAIFILVTSQALWPEPVADWIPMLLVVLKLPCVVMLLRRLFGRPERNAVLAFHGGVLLFYFSALPVLVLHHGWIGLTLVFEAAALLWLNRRLEHPGLRWVSSVMAPAGLLILFFNLPLLKPLNSPPVLNAAVLSVAACFATLALSVRWAGFPHRELKRLDLPTYFQWLTVATGFFLANLIIADVFAEPGRAFRVWPGRHFPQSVSYALAWTAMGALTWRLVRLPRAIRWAGMLLVALGTSALIFLPFILPRAAAGMRPLFNVGLVAYPPLLAILYYLFHKEPWNETGSLLKNALLALFMVAGFLFIKLEASTLFQTGYPFTLFSSHTPEKAAASAAGWIAYGFALHVWPRRLDRPFRLTGMGLILIGVSIALSLPFRFRAAFAAMTPLLNPPSLVFLAALAALVYLTLKHWDERWPLAGTNPRVFWGIPLALAAFGVLNIEIASAFAVKGRPFSMLTHGSLSMQLAYSIGWLLFAIGLLVVGIKWSSVRVRWTAIAAIVITAVKIFIRDLWSLGQLYRVGSLLGLAVVLILVSFLYQRFLSEGKKNEI